MTTDIFSLEVFELLLQTTAIMVFVYAVFRRFYKINFTGFIVVCFFFVLAILNHMYDYSTYTFYRYLLSMILLLFIAIRHVYLIHRDSSDVK